MALTLHWPPPDGEIRFDEALGERATAEVRIENAPSDGYRAGSGAGAGAGADSSFSATVLPRGSAFSVSPTAGRFGLGGTADLVVSFTTRQYAPAAAARLVVEAEGRVWLYELRAAIPPARPAARAGATGSAAAARRG